MYGYTVALASLLCVLMPHTFYNVPADQMHSMCAVNPACLRVAGLAIHALCSHTVPREYVWGFQQPNRTTTKPCNKHRLRKSDLWFYCRCIDHIHSCILSKPTSKRSPLFLCFYQTVHTNTCLKIVSRNGTSLNQCFQQEHQHSLHSPRTLLNSLLQYDYT